METPDLKAAIEAVLFVAGEPILTEDLATALNITHLELQLLLDDMECHSEGRGITVRRYGTHVRLETKTEYAHYIEQLLNPVQKQKLSKTIMETLAVVAYRQPVTRGEIEQIRGVKCDYSVQLLLTKGLIREAGQKDTLGHPMTYVTTDEFLRHFGIGDLKDLPPLPENLPPENEDPAEAAQPLTP